MSLYGSNLEEHINLAHKMLDLEQVILQASHLLNETIDNKKKIFLCGNGGSAADCQHIAAELTGRFKKERRSLPAIALTVDTSALTAIGNDYGYDNVFARQLQGLATAGDCLIAISTSGNSTNVVEAVLEASKMGVASVGLLGKSGGALKNICDHAVIIPSHDTARIQEMHILIGHFFCQYIEDNLQR